MLIFLKIYVNLYFNHPLIFLMELRIEIPKYTAESGLILEWGDGFEIVAKAENGATIITANKEGLISLARHLLTLAQDEVPTGGHFHLDEYNSLESGSTELIIGKK